MRWVRYSGLGGYSLAGLAAGPYGTTTNTNANPDANEVPFLDLHYYGSPVVMSDAAVTATEESRPGLALDLASSSSTPLTSTSTSTSSSGSSLSTSAAWLGSSSPQLAQAQAQAQQQQPFAFSGMGRNGIGCVAPKALGAPFTIARPTTAIGVRGVDPDDGGFSGGGVADGFRDAGRGGMGGGGVGAGAGVCVAPAKLQMHQRGQSAVSPKDLLLKKGRDNKRKRASWDGGPR